MLNYLKKFELEILPSVAATVIGAYMLNHYVTKTAAPAPSPSPATPAETAAAEDHRDANDLARAAIERLRESQPNKTPEAPRTAVAPAPAQTASVRPLPPPIMVATPPADAPANT